MKKETKETVKKVAIEIAIAFLAGFFGVVGAATANAAMKRGKK